MRILVYGDSNSWGYLDDGSGVRFAGRWPVSMASALTAAGQDVELDRGMSSGPHNQRR